MNQMVDKLKPVLLKNLSDGVGKKVVETGCA